jgi:hypothetical protein
LAFCTLYLGAGLSFFMVANLAVKILGADNSKEFSDNGMLACLRHGLSMATTRICRAIGGMGRSRAKR